MERRVPARRAEIDVSCLQHMPRLRVLHEDDNRKIAAIDLIFLRAEREALAAMALGLVIVELLFDLPANTFQVETCLAGTLAIGLDRVAFLPVATEGADHHWMKPDAVFTQVTDFLFDEQDLDLKILRIALYPIDGGGDRDRTAVQPGIDLQRGFRRCLQIVLQILLETLEDSGAISRDPPPTVFFPSMAKAGTPFAP